MQFSSSDELRALQKRIIQQSDKTIEDLRLLFSTEHSLSVLKKIKFEKLVTDNIFNDRMNFIEYLNQTFTYLVCLYAANTILKRFSPNAVIINFGTQCGYDVSSVCGSIVCECFSSTSVKSNEKLKKDVLRLHRNTTAKEKFVFFYSDAAVSELSYIKKISEEYQDVTLCSVSFDDLVGSY